MRLFVPNIRQGRGMIAEGSPGDTVRGRQFFVAMPRMHDMGLSGFHA
jgi:hypothetical protein